MRLLVLCVLGGLLVWFVPHWFTQRKHPMITALLILTFLPTGALEARWLLRQHQYTAVTRDLVNDDSLKVHCQRTFGFLIDVSGYMGYVPYPPGQKPIDAYLRNDTCRRLGDFVSSPDSPSVDEARAVHVLTHEAMHLAGVKDEARAECMAIQRNHVTAEALGATPATALAVAHSYWAEVHPRTPKQYQSASCAPGAEWDERIAGSLWETSPMQTVG